ncbi:MAG TPA: response regulator [Polyangiaceae bacterium]|nr:response regulator [Polyangiaceae bacterium]
MTTTILAVDDSKTLRKVFAITFAGEPQFNVVVAENANDALGKLHSVAPQVALVDVTLPDQNGYDLCGQIKSQSPSTAVVVLSSKQVPYDQGRGAAAGADDFIDKPFDTQQLIDKVSKLSVGGGARAAAPAPAPIAMPSPPQASAQPQAFKAPSAVPRVVAAAPAADRHIKSVPPPKPKSSAPAVPAAAAAMGAGISTDQLAQLGLSPAQVEAVVALSRDVVERVVWEVVPVLAETLIKEEIRRLTAE